MHAQITLVTILYHVLSSYYLPLSGRYRLFYLLLPDITYYHTYLAQITICISTGRQKASRKAVCLYLHPPLQHFWVMMNDW
jgi:hypothetical protein